MSDDAAQPRKQRRRNRQLSARGVRLDAPDLHRMSRALVQVALEQAAAEAAAESQHNATKRGPARRRQSHPESTDD
jgi:hypothetical protein